MKILMLTTNSSLMDGINRHILLVASALNGKSSCEVAVCIAFPRGELADALEEKGVKTFSLGVSNGHDFSIFPAFRKVMKSFNPDIVHVHVVALFEKMMLSMLYRSKKYVCTVHGISDAVWYETFRMKIDKWLNDEFPGITKRAEAENAEIFFGDETNIQNTANYMKGYAPKGKTPVVKVESQKFKVNMLSAISKRGKLRFMLYKDNMDSDKLIDFMGRLIRDVRKKVFLILDNLRVHHSKKVQGWLEKHKDRIEVFYLPPYAPEYNPDELVNSDLKRAVGQKASPHSKDELEHNVRSHLKKLQVDPDKISSFFHAPFTAYAAF